MAVEDILLLRVGLDSSSGRGHGPLFEDDRFEYIPIPESAETTEDRTYDELPARTGGRLSEHAPHLAGRVPHFDPEFESFTYGDPSRNKRSQLSRLTANDLLIFYSSLSPTDVDVGPRLCVIGYFVVDTVYDFAAMSPDERDGAFETVANNAHVKREGLTRETPHRETYPVVVKGDPERSRLLTEPLPLGDGDRSVLPWVADVIGFEKDLTRAGVARVLDEDNAAEIRRWLGLGSDYLVGEDATLRVCATGPDAGPEPNVTGGHCTFTEGETRTRTDAEVGDWILVTPSNADRPERMTYLLRVDEATSGDEYRRDERFETTDPETAPRGDDTRRRDDGPPERETAANRPADESESHREQDSETGRVLVSSLFWDFGAEGVAIPERLRHRVSRQRDSNPGQPRSRRGRDALCELVSWVSLRFDPGVNGEAAESRGR